MGKPYVARDMPLGQAPLLWGDRAWESRQLMPWAGPLDTGHRGLLPHPPFWAAYLPAACPAFCCFQRQCLPLSGMADLAITWS